MPGKPNHRRGEALDRARAERWLRRAKPLKRPAGHPKDCICYDCLWGPEHQIDPDSTPHGGRRG